MRSRGIRAALVRDLARPDQADRLHTAWATQLANDGMVPWAVLVALHVSAPTAYVQKRSEWQGM